MAKVTTLEKLHSDIMKILEEYADDVERKSDECVRKVAQKGALALKRESPKKSGDYSRGWTYRLENKRTGCEATLYNADRPGLAHLLEYGHETRNGTGRTYDPTPAYPHIQKVENQIIEDFGRAVKAAII